MAVATIFTELDIDLSKFKDKQRQILKDIELVGSESDKAFQYAFGKLGVTADKVYQGMATLARVSYEKIAASANASCAEQYRAHAAMVAKINAINQQMNASPGFAALGIRSSASIIAEMQNVQEFYRMEKAAAAGNARDIEAIEAAKNAKLTALSNEYNAVQISNDAKEIASAKAVADAKLAAQEKIRAQGLMQIDATKEDIARTKAALDQKTKDANANYDTLGMKSSAYYTEQINSVKNAATAQQAIVGKGSEEWTRIEKQKNTKLKELNKEMVGDHEMSMASMTRAVLRFYAAFYVISAATQVLGQFFMSAIKAIDDMKVSTIGVAAQITTMQGTTSNVAENYKKNLEYAEALVPVLQQIDANSFANLSQIQKMNMAMSMQGTILDVNNQKQIESFTALTNAVALFTQGQDKEKQASQEIRALFSGQVKEGNMVALMIDQQIKKTGEYKDGLKGLVEEGRKYGDTLERLTPYLTGIIAASGDIQSTWAAVSSSIETTWNILQRGLFKDMYKSLVDSGQKVSTWLKKNQEEVIATINNIYETIAFATKAVIGAFILVATTAVAQAIIAGDAWAWFALRYEAMAAKVTMATSAMTIGWTVFVGAIVGFSIGKYLSNEFEWARFAGISMVYGVINAWELFVSKLKIGWEYLKIAATAASNMSPQEMDEQVNISKARIKALQDGYKTEQDLRDKFRDEQFRDESDAGKALAKQAADIAKKNVIAPILPLGARGSGDGSVSKDSKNELDKQIAIIKEGYDTAIAASNEYEAKQRAAGENELKLISEIWNKRNDAIYESYSLQWDAIEKSKLVESEKEEMLAKLNKDISQKENKNSADLTKDRINAANKHISIMSDVYKTIDKYSTEAMAAEIDSIDKKYKLALAFANTQAEIDAIELARKKAISDYTTELKIQEISELTNFYSTVVGFEQQAYDEKIKLIELERKSRIDAAKGSADEVAAINAKATQDSVKALKVKIDADWEVTSSALNNLSTITDKAKECYAEDSYEYNRLNDLKKGILIAQQAMEIAKNIQTIAGIGAIVAAKQGEAVINAVTSATSAGSGDPYTGIARVAAMIAMMAGVLAIAGIAFSPGGSSSDVAAPGYKPPSTLLGAEAGTESASIVNSFELLKDTYSMENTKLTKIYNELRDLNNNITGLVTNIVRTGGVGVTADLLFKEKGDVPDFLQNNPSGLFNKYFEPMADKFGLQGLKGMDSFMKIFSPVYGFVSLLPKLWDSAFGGSISSQQFAGGVQFGGASNRSLQNGGSMGGQQYGSVVWKKDGGWLGKDEVGTYDVYAAMNSEVSDMFDKVFKNMGSTLVALAEGLGQDVNAALNYVFAGTRINLMGMSGEAIQKTLQAWFSAAGDTAVSSLFGDLLRGYQELNEGLMETAVRIMTQRVIVLDVLKQTNQSFEGAIPAGLKFADTLIKMAGGLEALQDSVATYYEAFFSDTEKQTRLQGQLSDAFTNMNLVLPTTRTGYRDLVEGLDLTTESGMEAYVALLQLSEMADAYYTGLTEAQQKLVDAQSDVVDTLIGYIEKLQNAYDSLRMEGTVIANQTANARLAFGVVLEQAKLGDFSGIGTLDKTLSDLVSGANSTAGFSNRTDYARSFYQTQSMIDELKGLTVNQLTIEQQTYNTLKAQLDVLMNIDQNIATSTGGTPAGFAYGGISSGSDGGYIATLHGTELIVSPKANYPATVKGGINAELIEEVRALRKELNAANFQIAKNTLKISRTTEKWDGEGLPTTRT